MGAAHSSASAASLQAHEPLLARLAGPDPVDDADDAYWAALLTTVGVGGSNSSASSSSLLPPAAALAALPPADVEAALAPTVRGLLAHNARTRNWQLLVARFGPLVADRAAEAMQGLWAPPPPPPPGKSNDKATATADNNNTTPAAYARDSLAAANAMHLVAVVLKLVAEAPEEQGGGSAGLARLFAVPPGGTGSGATTLAPAFCARVAALLAHAPPCPLLVDPSSSPSASAAASAAAARRRWSEACYLPLLEATRLALAMTAGQLAAAASPAAPLGCHPLLEALFEALGKGMPGAGALAAQLLRVAVARPEPPPAGFKLHAPAHAGAGLSLLGGAAPAAPGTRSAVARVFWGVKQAAAAAGNGVGCGKTKIQGTASNSNNSGSSSPPDEAGAAGCGGPLGDGALLLLLLLLHFPAHHAGLGENCVRQAIYDLEDEDFAEPVAAAAVATAPLSLPTHLNDDDKKKKNKSRHDQGGGPPPVPAAAPPPTMAPPPLAMSASNSQQPLPHLPPIKVVANGGGKGGKKFALRVPFSALLAHLSRPYSPQAQETEAGTLLLYSLLHGNRAFRERALACSADERAALLLPLLRALYGATTAPPPAAHPPPPQNGRGGAAAPAAPPATPFFAASPNHLYMLQIVLLILSQDQAFAAAVHSRRGGRAAGPVLPASAVSWYAERRLASGSNGGPPAAPAAAAPRLPLAKQQQHHHQQQQQQQDQDVRPLPRDAAAYIPAATPAALGTATAAAAAAGGGVTLGSLMFVVLLRSAAHSFGAAALAHDLYLPTNTLAALANLAPHARGLHPHAAQRLVGLACSLGKRYLRARRALELRRRQQQEEAAAGAAAQRRQQQQQAGGGDGTAANAATPAAPPTSTTGNNGLTEEQVNVLGDFLRIVLEVVNAVLAAPPFPCVSSSGGPTGAGAADAVADADPAGAAGNPELVYAVMHRRDALAELKQCPRVSELADNAMRAADFFSARLAEAVALSQGLPPAAAAAAALAPNDQPLPPEWGVERVLQAIASAAPGWSPERAGMKPLPELRFVYEEEEQAEDFFVPYGLAVALAGASAAGLQAWDLARVRLLVLQQQMQSVQGQQGQQQGSADDDELAAARGAAAASALAASAALANGRAAASTLAPAISGALSLEDASSLGGDGNAAGGAYSSFRSLPTLLEEEQPSVDHFRKPTSPVAAAPPSSSLLGRLFGW
jgi:hypothetical protein